MPRGAGTFPPRSRGKGTAFPAKPAKYYLAGTISSQYPSGSLMK